MTKTQAAALSAALEGQQIPHTVAVTFPTPTTEQWNVQLPPNVTYGGPTLAQLANYCATNGLTLSIIVQSMGVV